MHISIMGTGYVGLTTGIGFALNGHHVICVEKIAEKVEMINQGRPPIYEPGLADALQRAVAEKRLRATTDLEPSIIDTQITFMAVGTPSKKDGSIDLTDIRTAAESIGRALREKNAYHVVAVKSTVVPGTTGQTVIPAIERTSAKKAGTAFGVCMNPEFLREGKALEDVLRPDRVVIGAMDKRSGDLLQQAYAATDSPILRTDLKTAEMIKYANNALLATKISFANEIGNICKKLGIDTYKVMEGVGLDRRLSPAFLQAGCGWGGSCFPKDVAALIATAAAAGYEPRLLNSVVAVNQKQKTMLVDQLEQKIGSLRGKRIALLGLAFKPDTDDIREATSIAVIQALQEQGARIAAYDPQAADNMKRLFPEVDYAKAAREALQGSDACLVLTEWPEFTELTDADFAAMKRKVIIEGRRVLDPGKVTGFDGICW